MPIKITDNCLEKPTEVAWLCNDEWELPAQIKALEDWLRRNSPSLPAGSYTADVGYSPRVGAAGGGVTVTVAAMNSMSSIGMELHLSEYPPFEER